MVGEENVEPPAKLEGNPRGGGDPPNVGAAKGSAGADSHTDPEG